MKKRVSIAILIIGAILFTVGVFLKIPSKELTTVSIYAGERSVIEEYVGGDAYNYIIGASLVGGEIAGAKTQQAICVSGGLLIICFGLFALSHSTETNVSKAPTAPVETGNNSEEQNSINTEMV